MIAVSRRTPAVFLSLLILAGACTPAATPGSTQTAGATGPQGTVTVALNSFGKETVDKSLDTGQALNFLGPMLDFFIGATPDGKLSTANGVLESFQTTDAKVYTFKLRSGIKWHDGTDMTSDDIKFSLEWHARKEAGCTSCSLLKANLDRVEVVDTLTVRVFLKNPDVAFIDAIGPVEGDLVVLPKAYIEKVGPSGYANAPIGSGPFKFVAHKTGESFEYGANTSYWNTQRTPSIAKLRILNVPEARTREAMLRTGEADLIQSSAVDAPNLEKAGFKIVGPKSTGQSMITFLRSSDPTQLTNKLEFRKALALAADWQAINKAFYPAGGSEALQTGTALFNPLAKGFDPALAPYPFNPTEAKNLLSQAGYNGQKLTFWSWPSVGGEEGKGMDEAIASAWKQVGINVEIVPVDQGTFISKVSQEPQVFPAGANVTIASPSTRPSALGNIRIFMTSHKTGGLVEGYWNPKKIDPLWLELSGIVDEQTRIQRLLALNRELYNEYWAIPIVMRHYPFAASSKIANWQPVSGTAQDLAFQTLKLKP